MSIDNYRKPEYYLNREISWIRFNERVLGEAKDHHHPLFERLKFLGITASNLDEFVMIRVASLKDMAHAGYLGVDIAGLSPTEQLERLGPVTHDLVKSQYSTYNRSLVPMLKHIGFEILKEHEDLDKTQVEFVDKYFEENVYPVLTPMAVDSSRPFPMIRNKTLNIGALIQKKSTRKNKKIVEFATVQVPSVLPRIVELPKNEDNNRCVILLEEIIERNIGKLFMSYHVVCAHPYRIMRNADLSIDVDEAADLLKEIQKQLKMRQWGEVIRLEVESSMPERLLNILQEAFSIKEERDIFLINGPLDLTFLMTMYELEGFERNKSTSYDPAPVPELRNKKSIFNSIRKRDVLLHHPYMSFEPVIKFVQEAASDPDVLAIKQTLYRVSGHSPIIAALAQAAENGKQVTVLVELKARFDEENNIVWAKMLEKAGCHVIYGLPGLKTHCKITLVVRKEKAGIRRYVHLGTGNYNDTTARLYTDCGLLTCDNEIGEDATAVFNMLSGYSEPKSWNKLVVAPLWMKKRFLELIERESNHAKAGQAAVIIAKANSLCDEEIIAALYEASAAGVKINLIIRGICSLMVGIPGVSENIIVHSIIGDFLEHARIFYFKNNGDEEIYMGSADWMPRNLDKRVEIIFPVEDEVLKGRVKHILDVQLADNVKSHLLKPDGSYEKISAKGKVRINAQKIFCEET